METYSANITLKVNDFKADSLEEAHNIIDKYIDELADTKGSLRWDSVEWETN